MGFVLTFVLVMAGGYFLWQFWHNPGPYPTARTLILQAGTGMAQTARKLEAEGLVKSWWQFRLAALLTGDAARLQAGEYLIPARASPAAIFDQFIHGKVVDHQITIPEGWTSGRILAALQAAPSLQGPAVQDLPEGSILPDSWHYRWGDRQSDIIKRMADAQQKLIDELWLKRADNLAIATKQEAIILASLIEAEAALPQERQRISAVFHNRLRKNMRLQTDPSVIYAITRGQYELGRPLTRADLKRDDPYNSYRRHGLPPTPINHPGRDAIYAALNPLDSDELYFVADGTGGHKFAKTLAQHNKNVKEYRASLKAKQAE